MKKILLALCFSFSFNVFANECSDLAKCVEFVSNLTGKKYMYDGALKGEFKASSNFQLTAENADTLFSTILNINGYTRIPTAVKDTYKIIEARDVRYATVPTIQADMKTTPEIAMTEDYVFLAYKFNYYKQGQTREASNSARPFMSRYGRIIEVGNTVTVQEVANKIPQMLEILRRADREYSKEEIALMEKREVRLERKAERESKKEKTN